MKRAPAPETAAPAAPVALVTGGAVGIGAAVARALAERGCRVVLTYRSHRTEADGLVSELGCRAYALDLARPREAAELAARVTAEVGAVQVLVHNAGATRDALLPFLGEADWERVLEVNLSGAFRLTRALLRGMLAARWGRVIAVASLSGQTGQAGQAHYAAAKAGLIGLVKTVARETASFGVTANAVVPGFIDTAMLAALPEPRLEEYRRLIPAGRFGRPEEVAAAVAFLASADAAYITGQALRIDGGLVTA
jgi:NAD(P)-dependent dehydrogenase (short-subunit alcohol dehydrogenase family)